MNASIMARSSLVKLTLRIHAITGHAGGRHRDELVAMRAARTQNSQPQTCCLNQYSRRPLSGFPRLGTGAHGCFFSSACTRSRTATIARHYGLCRVSEDVELGYAFAKQRCALYVRLCPESGGVAETAALRFCARTGRCTERVGLSRLKSLSKQSRTRCRQA